MDHINYSAIESLDDIGLLGNPSCRHSKRKEAIFNAAFNEARARLKSLGRELTNEEIQALIKESERNYNRKKRQENKAASTS
jgi:hypothetical protein